MTKRVAVFSLLIDQSRDQCATVEGAGKSVFAGFVREKSGRRVWLQRSAFATVFQEQSSLAPPEEKKGRQNYRHGSQFYSLTSPK